MTNDELLHKWVQQSITTEELAVFKLRPEFEELTQLYKKTENLVAPSFDSEKMLGSILAEPKAKESVDELDREPNKSRTLSGWIKYGLAACVVLVAGYFLMPQGDLVHLTTTQGLAGKLPDQSSFQLEANSKLSYDKANWKDNRAVALEGGAFFKVKKGSAFKVETKLGFVEVLGTDFNVDAEETSLAVDCKEGRVSVSSVQNNYSEILEAGERMILKASGHRVTWKKDVTKMKQVSFTEVIENLSRFYKVEFKGDLPLSSVMMNCSFGHDNLELALESCLKPTGFNYELVGSSTVLLKK